MQSFEVEWKDMKMGMMFLFDICGTRQDSSTVIHSGHADLDGSFDYK